MRSLHVTDERLHPADIDRATPVEYLDQAAADRATVIRRALRGPTT
ncbi:hypothetical protein [Gordonia malaquae]